MSSPIERFAAADAILREALDRPAPARREYVALACGSDAELRAAVERLLAAADVADSQMSPGGALAGPLWDDLAVTLAADSHDLAPGTRLGPYEVIALVGEGGMGRVYRARDPRLARDVALKILGERKAGRVHSERFGREARAASALNHPNIVTIYDIGDAGGVAYIAMEYLSGGSLRERLAAGRIELDDALDLAGQVAQGLAAAHARGVVHRDLKPGNVMITADGGAKIVDFGLAKLEPREEIGGRPLLPNEPLTAAGAIFGTVAYMSPEQASGRPVDYRSDLFSFGAMLYELVTGQRPFERGSTAETLAAILKEHPPAASAFAPSIPPPLEWAIERCLAKDPQNRYESTRDLARDLKAVRDYRARLRPVAAVTAPGDLRCSACGAPGDRDRRFCERCGAEFRRRCPGCAADVAPQAAFCSSCGQRLSSPELAPDSTTGAPPVSETAPPSRSHEVMSGERRQATILASRIPGYEALVERAAPEDVDRVMEAFESEARATVERFGGVVDRIAGDEVVALFGIPVAHEDDARRATRAALSLHARFRQGVPGTGEVQLRSAVHTGQVVVRTAPDRPHGVRVVGEALSDATGLLRGVRDGDVLVSQETLRLAGTALRAEPAGPVQVRSEAPPLVTFRITAADDSSAPPLESTDVPLTPFAGRQGELGALAGSVEMAIAGEGQVVTLIGDAGAGKSRLLYELRRQVDPDRIALVEGRCQSYGARVPYLPLVQCCRSVLQLRESDPPDVQRRKLRDGLRALDRELEAFLPIFHELLSIAGDEAAPRADALPARHAVQEALAGLFSLAARRRPLLMLLEDWHWVDEASHDVARQLADLCPSYPLMMVITYRPDVKVDWGALRHIRVTHLPSLGPLSSGQIVRSVLAAERVAEPLAARLHERSGGNPFFLEELCRKLLEEGAVQVEGGEARVAAGLEGLQLPDSVQAVIRARLDRLDRDARDLLRRAAVIGREFSASVLAAVVEGDLDIARSLMALKERGLIRQTRVVPEPAYRFQHALTQEVAYDSLLHRQRQLLHGRVGSAIEALYGGHLQDQFGILARHFAEAEHWPKAVEYGRKFARRAHHLSQFDDAAAALDLTLEWTLKLPADGPREHQLIELLLEKEQLCEVLGDRAQQQETIDRLLALLEARGDRPELIAVYARQAELFAAARRFADGERLLERALAVSRRLHDTTGERDTLRSLSFLFWLQGRNEEALAAVDRALEIDRPSGDPERISGDLTNRGAILRSLGRLDAAIESLEEALRITAPDRGDDLSRHVEALYVLHTIYRDTGEPEKAEPYLARALEISSEDRFRLQMPFPVSAMANLLLERGEIERALDLFRRAVELGRQSRYAFGLAHNLRGLAEALVGIGREDEALPYLREAADLARRLVDREAEIAMLAQVAPLVERRGQNDEAAQAWQRLLDLTRDNGSPAVAVNALNGLARAAERAGHHDRALRFLRDALPLANAEQRGRVLNEIGIREWKRGQFAVALDAFREALEVFEGLEQREHIGLMLNSIGSCLARLGRGDEAQACLERAVRLHADAGQPLLEGHALALLGDVALSRRDAAAALASYEQSLAIRQRLGDRRGEGWMRHHLARACREAGEGDRAGREAALAVAIGREIGDAELTAAGENLAGEAGR